jgi:hypothetical protein
MRTQSSVRAGWLVVAFLSSVGLARAQIAPASEMPTGDVWRSDAEHIHRPMSGDAEAEEEPSWDISPPTNTGALHADCTVTSQYERRNHAWALRAAINSGRHREHLGLSLAAGRRHSVRHGLPQGVRLVSFRCRIDAPGSEMGRAP